VKTLILIAFLLSSPNAHSISCVHFAKGVRSHSDVYSTARLIKSRLIYSSFFNSSVTSVLNQIVHHGLPREKLEDIMSRENLSDLEVIAGLIYTKMNKGHFPTAEAEAQFRAMPEGLMVGQIVDSLLLNAKYKEAVTVGPRVDITGLEERGDVLASIGFHGAPLLWVGSSLLLIFIDDVQIVTKMSVILTSASLIMGTYGLNSLIRSSQIAAKSEERYTEQILNDLQNIRLNTTREEPSVSLQTAVLSAQEKTQNQTEVIPSILF